MLSIFKFRKKQAFPFERLRTDMHSHLIPGIDDGAPDLETSMELVKGLLELGYEKLITTPHIMWDIHKNTSDIILENFAKLEQQLKAEEYGVEMKAAAEYFLDDYFDEIFSKEQPLLKLDDTKLLVEISFVTPPLRLKEKVFDMLIKGYQPVLAHPERYPFYHRDKKHYEELKNAGFHFQANLLSFTGYYGKAVQEVAEWLAQKDLINLLGTDLHHPRHLDNLRAMTLTPALQKILDSSSLLNTEL